MANEYVFVMEKDNVAVYHKYLGDNEILLEYNLKTKEIHKYCNDFRKKVLIETDNSDREFIALKWEQRPT